MAKITRRQFLRATGVGLGATTLACAGLGYLAGRAPAQAVDFYQKAMESEGEGMGGVLIAYASKLGSTGEVAKAICDTLAAGGNPVEVKRVGDVGDVSAYDAVLLGSAVRMGRWLPEAVDFLERNAGPLASKPVSFFSVCMTMFEDTQASRARAQKITTAAHAIREPAAEAFFGGRMDYGRLSFAEQMILRAMKVPEGDYRDWEAIRAWSEQLPLR
jgi:menaquinone-dependent protoporphyrinogen oxidase